jgi:hypothetical protein
MWSLPSARNIGRRDEAALGLELANKRYKRKTADDFS